MTDKLTPVRCGCRGEAIAYIESMDGGFWHRIYVSCAKCGIRTPKFDTEAEAIEAWNRAMGADKVNELMEHVWREKLDTREKIAEFVKRMLK